MSFHLRLDEVDSTNTRLKEAALLYGTAPPGMAAAWREDVAELSAEAEEVALYG